MSYSDRLYPGNPRRRYEAENLHQQLLKSALPNAHVTHMLMDYMKAYLHRQLEFAKILKDDELNQACIILLTRIAAIQKDLRTVDKKLKQRLPSSSYLKLQGIDEPKAEATVKLHSRLVPMLWCLVILVLVVNVPVVCYYISTVINDVPLKLFIQVNAALSLILGAVCLAFGMNILLSTVLGAWEKHQLKAKIKNYKSVLSEIQPQPKNNKL